MHKQILKLWRDPFSVDLADRAARLFVDPPTGDILMDSAVLYAWKGLVFSLIPAQAGEILRLQYRDITIDIGWTAEPVEAATWVEDVNRFLATKKENAATNGKIAPLAPAVKDGPNATSPHGA